VNRNARADESEVFEFLVHLQLPLADHGLFGGFDPGLNDLIPFQVEEGLLQLRTLGRQQLPFRALSPPELDEDIIPFQGDHLVPEGFLCRKQEKGFRELGRGT